jgi:hypothetical protein
LGADGEGWEEITRSDLDLYSDVNVKVVSSSLEMKNSQLKKEARMKILSDIALNPLLAPQVNPRWTVEELLRSGGEYDDQEIKLAMDTKNYGNKEEVPTRTKVSRPSSMTKNPICITAQPRCLCRSSSTSPATTAPHSNMAKYTKLMNYATADQAVAQENMQRKAKQDAAAMLANPTAAPAPGPAATATPPTAPGATAVPSANTQMREVASNLP